MSRELELVDPDGEEAGELVCLETERPRIPNGTDEVEDEDRPGTVCVDVAVPASTAWVNRAARTRSGTPTCAGPSRLERGQACIRELDH